MADKITAERRSANMARIRSRDMKPELAVRSMLHRAGYRFRLHARELPGKPDLVFRSRRKAIFVHGCFWHQHEASHCLDGRKPKTNSGYWDAKLERNVERDQAAIAALRSAGWGVFIVWECELRSPNGVLGDLRVFLGPPGTQRLRSNAASPTEG